MKTYSCLNTIQVHGFGFSYILMHNEEGYMTIELT